MGCHWTVSALPVSAGAPAAAAAGACGLGYCGAGTQESLCNWKVGCKEQKFTLDPAAVIWREEKKNALGLICSGSCRWGVHLTACVPSSQASSSSQLFHCKQSVTFHYFSPVVKVMWLEQMKHKIVSIRTILWMWSTNLSHGLSTEDEK